MDPAHAQDSGRSPAVSRRALLLSTLLVLFAIPVPAASLLGGAPLESQLEVGLAVALIAGAVAGGLSGLSARWTSRRAFGLLAVCAALELGAALLCVEHGLSAVHRAAYTDGEAEISIRDRSRPGITRIDRELDLDDEGHGLGLRRFDLHWLNRYRYVVPAAQRPPRVYPDAPGARADFVPSPRLRPTFEADWTAWVVPPASGEYGFRLEGGRDRELAIGGTRAGPRRPGALRVQLVAGAPTRIEASAHFDERTDTRARLVWSTPDGGESVVPASRLYPSLEEAQRAGLDRVGRVLHGLGSTLATLFGLALASALWRAAARDGLRRRMLALFAVAIGLRLALHLAHFALPHAAIIQRMEGDDYQYFSKAYGLILRDPWLPDRAYYWSPLYRYFLVAVQLLVGEGLQWVALIQRLLGAVTTVVVFAIGRRLWSERAGWIAAGLCLVWPAFHVYEGIAFTEALATCLFSVAFLRLLQAESGGSGALLRAGAWLGSAALVRPNLVLAAPLIGLWLWTRGGATRERLRRIGRHALGVAAVVGIATLRNLVVGGEFVPISSNGPINLLIGNHAGATGEYTAPPAGSAGREVATVLEFVRDDPAGWLRLVGRKLDLLLSHRATLPWLVLGAIGVAVAARRRPDSALLLCLWVATLLAVIPIFFFDERFLHPALPALFLLASVGLAELPLTPRMRPVIAALAIPAGALLLLVNHYLMAVVDRLQAPFSLGDWAWLVPWLG
jgi:hypothetical protein